jgi:hypothetical protein
VAGMESETFCSCMHMRKTTGWEASVGLDGPTRFGSFSFFFLSIFFLFYFQFYLFEVSSNTTMLQISFKTLWKRLSKILVKI